MIQGTTDATSASAASVTSSTQKPMDREAFLNLLVTQLKNQDPMNPMDDTQFVTQLAQFSSLEQMQNMNSTLGTSVTNQATLEAVSLIGRNVDAVDSSTGNTITGVVDKVFFQSGQAVLEVGGNDIQLSDVSSVSS